MQVKLLRAIQSGEIKPVGDNTSQIVDVRLIAATNREPPGTNPEGLFREDLFYRVNVFPILIPPLRDRTDDIPMLVLHFLDKFSVLTANLCGASILPPWNCGLDIVGRENVRELENEVERSHILASDGGNISVRCLSPRIRESIRKDD